MKKRILDVFNTYADAYLEYVNEFISMNAFIEHYELDKTEVDILFEAAKDVKAENMKWLAIDYFFNKRVNCNYSEKNIHF